jgi:hypothetical protein
MAVLAAALTRCAAGTRVLQPAVALQAPQLRPGLQPAAAVMAASPPVVRSAATPQPLRAAGVPPAPAPVAAVPRPQFGIYAPPTTPVRGQPHCPCLVLFGMQNRTFGSCLAAMNRTLMSAVWSFFDGSLPLERLSSAVEAGARLRGDGGKGDPGLPNAPGYGVSGRCCAWQRKLQRQRRPRVQQGAAGGAAQPNLGLSQDQGASLWAPCCMLAS